MTKYIYQIISYMHYDKIYLVCVCVTRCQRGTVDLIFVFYLFDSGIFFFLKKNIKLLLTKY